MKKKIINLTNHDIGVLTRDGQKTVIPRDGQARCSISRIKVNELDVNGVMLPINDTIMGDVAGLPEERDDTIIIVSAIVYHAIKHRRNDVYTVDEPVRNERGQVIGVRSLSKVKESK